MAQTPNGTWIERVDARLAGALLIAVVLVVVFFAFTKAVPLQQDYRIRAVMQSSNLLVPGAPVRIAGVRIGKVVAIDRYGNSDLAEVTMQIDARGRPIRRDAALKVRPKLFLEGAFYVDLQPGSPGTPELADGGVIPLTHTAVPVQLDQAVSPLRAGVRRDLQGLVQGLGNAVGSRPTPEEDATLDPADRGITGGAALNRTLGSSPQALRDGAIVADALRGERPGDLTRMLGGLARTMDGLASEESRLTGLVRDLDVTFGTTALHATSLRETVRAAAGVATRGRESLVALHDVLPPTQRLARELAVGLDELPATIRVSGPWLDQALPLLGDRELGGLARALAPATASIAGLTGESRRLLPQVEALSRCGTELLIPASKVKLDDGPLSSGIENYKELWHAMVGQASEGQGFDGNGSFLRLQAIGGARTLRSGKTNYSGRSMVSSSAVDPQRTAPAFTAVPPPVRRDVACADNPRPDLNGPASRGPADGSRPDGAPPAPPKLSATPPEGFRP